MIQDVVAALFAAAILAVIYFAGYDFGRKNLVVDIDSYGCEKVVTIYHGIHK